MNIAIIYSGHMRGYSSAFNIQKQSFIKNENVDIFISTWETYGWWTSKDTLIDKTADNIDVNDIIQTYNPVSIKVDKYFPEYEKFFDVEKEKYIKFHKNTLVRIPNILSLYYKIQDVVSMLMKYSTLMNKKYDIVIRTRPDLLIDCDIIQEFLKNQENIYIDGRDGWGKGVSDLLMVSTYDNIVKLKTIYDDLYDIVECCEYFCSHLIFNEFLKRNNFSFVKLKEFNFNNTRNGQWKE